MEESTRDTTGGEHERYGERTEGVVSVVLSPTHSLYKVGEIRGEGVGDNFHGCVEVFWLPCLGRLQPHTQQQLSQSIQVTLL